MDILRYVQLCIPAPAMSRRTQFQFGVLAFDLGEVAPEPHPPPLEKYDALEDDPRKAGASGPWAVQVRNWAPAASLQIAEDGGYKLDKNGEFLVAERGKPEKICSERWLLGGLSGYLRRYHRTYGRLPLSVSLYTVMAPCPRCNAYMRRFPSATHAPVGAPGSGGTIPAWYLAYTRNYDFAYPTAAEGDMKTAELSACGWHVVKG